MLRRVVCDAAQFEIGGVPLAEAGLTNRRFLVVLMTPEKHEVVLFR